jgi:hypothetical protein
VSGAAEHCVHGVAQCLFQPVATQLAAVLHVADGRFDGTSALDYPLEGTMVDAGRYRLATDNLWYCYVEKCGISCAWKPPLNLQGKGQSYGLFLQIQHRSISPKTAWMLGFRYI